LAQGPPDFAARRHAPPPAAAMSDLAALVAQVKSIQRSDAEAKQVWWDYCDTHLGGVKDPSRHDASVLSDFISGYNSGQYTAGTQYTGSTTAAKVPQRRPAAPVATAYSYPAPTWDYTAATAYPSAWSAAGGGGGGGLDEFVKTGQRRSQHWKAAWQAYCALYGTGYNDPAKYDESFTVGFIDYVGQLVSADLQAQAAEQGVALDGASAGGQKRPWSGAPQQPPAKRMAVSSGAAKAAGGAAVDPEKAALVDKVKAFQRTGTEAKNAWWAFCDEHNQGVKDPIRHDKESLEQFLAGYE